MAESVGVRQWNGITVPTPGIFEIDAAHTTVGFVARHLMVTQVRGRFEHIKAAVHVAADPLESFAHATVRTASITTGAVERDDHLRSADFLDVEAYPEMIFASREIAMGEGGPRWAMAGSQLVRRRRDPRRISVTGDLTIKGVTHPIELDVGLDGVTSDPWGGERLALSATGEIDREAYGMTWNVALEAGGWLVSQQIQIEIRAQAIRKV